MIRRLRRHIALACAGLLIAVSGIVLTASQQDAQAADASNFRPGYLISDENFYDSAAMSVSQIQDFLNKRGSSCTGNCLKDKRVDTVSKAANRYCGAYQGARGESAAQIISKVGKACGISPKVLLVMLEKETSLVTMDNPGEWRYERAMGYYCPDDPNRPGWCNPEYAGLHNQLYRAAWQFNQYAANRGDYAYVAGRNNSILYNPDRSCGASNVYIENQATASLYIYTPYQPNQAALSNLYGTGNGCSSYGNRNFWRLYTDWFGSPTEAPGKSPIGNFDLAAAASDGVRIRGWAADPDAWKTPLYMWVTVNGKGQHVYANKSRPDVGRAVPSAGAKHGFDTVIKTPSGTNTVCITAHNLGGGGHKSLGCKSVSTGRSPVGNFDSIVANDGGVRIRGWAADFDAPKHPLYMWVTIDGKGQHIRANKSRPDVGRVLPSVGSAHGFDSTLAAGTGAHTVCVTAHNLGGGTHKPFGCKTVTVSPKAGSKSASASVSSKASSSARAAKAATPERAAQKSTARQQALSVIPRSAADEAAANDEQAEERSTEALGATSGEISSESAAAEEPQGNEAASERVEPDEPAPVEEDSAEVSESADSSEQAEPVQDESKEADSSDPAEPGRSESNEQPDSTTDSAAAENADRPEAAAPQPLSVIPDEDAAEAPNSSSSDASELAATGMQPMATPVLAALGVLLVSAAALLGMQALRREP